MATTQKITKAQKFAMLKAIPAVAENAMLVDFIEHELELLAKKNSAEKKPTAKQTANASVQAQILEAMEPNRAYTITELMKEIPGLPEDMTNQKMSALVRQLKDEGKIVREVIKRRAYFTLVE